MMNKFLASALLTVSGFGFASAQEAKVPTERSFPQVFLNASLDGSYLGVYTQEVTRENYSRFGLGEVRGVAVERVAENSPAAQAGLQPNDVIISFDGEEVKSTRKLTRLVSEVAPDHKARITILRGGSEREITVTLGRRNIPQMEYGNFRMENIPNLKELRELKELERIPLPPTSPTPPNFGDDNVFIWRMDSNRQLGVSVTSLTKQLGDYFGISEGKGLLVNNVRENSPAAKAGIRAGDIIVEVEGKTVGNSADLVRTINEKKEGAVNLTIIRDKARQTISVEPVKIENKLTAPEGGMNLEKSLNVPSGVLRLAPGRML